MDGRNSAALPLAPTARAGEALQSLSSTSEPQPVGAWAGDCGFEPSRPAFGSGQRSVRNIAFGGVCPICDNVLYLILAACPGDTIKGKTDHPQPPVDKAGLREQSDESHHPPLFTPRLIVLAGNWQIPAHIALALGMGFSCGFMAQRCPAVIDPLAAVIIGTFALYPLMLTIWWRLNR